MCVRLKLENLIQQLVPKDEDAKLLQTLINMYYDEGFYAGSMEGEETMQELEDQAYCAGFQAGAKSKDLEV